MPHEKNIPAQKVFWDHVHFSGRRVNKDDGTPDSGLSYWAINYGEYPSKEDAKNDTNCQRLTGLLTVRGELLDSAFLNDAGTGYEMTDPRVVGLLKKLLSEELSESELADVDGDLRRARHLMAGTPMFGIFTVTELAS